MNRKTILKRLLLGTITSVMMLNSAVGISGIAVETDRTWRYGMGDVAEDDDRQTIYDEFLLKKYLLGMVELSQTQLNSADLNFDGKVNVMDMLYMHQSILGTNQHDDKAIDDLQVAISNSDNLMLKTMRDVIASMIYEYKTQGWGYNSNYDTNRTYVVNGETFTGCRTDCSTAVTMALYSAGVLDMAKVKQYLPMTYLNTYQLVNSFSTIQKCVNDGFELSLIKIVPGTTEFQVGDILVYPSGHTCIVVSTSENRTLPSSLTSDSNIKLFVYGAGGDFASVHYYRLEPEFETIDQSSNGNTQSIRPYKYIIRVSTTS